MKARVLVFPIKGRNWCFTRSIDAVSGAGSSSPPPTLKDLWSKISAHGHSAQDRAEMAIDFFADRMNRAWIGLEKAPEGTLKSKIHSIGLHLLSRVKPSEIFLKSVSKDVTKVEVTYPASLNPRLVRRRLRHIAVRGSTIHRNYFYDSTKLQGSIAIGEKENGSTNRSNNVKGNVLHSPWVLKPSEDLQRFLNGESIDDGLSCSTISSICEKYDLEKKDVLKYKNSQ